MEVMDVDTFAQACHQNAVERGFWGDHEPPFGIQLTNMHSELSEAWEFYKNGYDMLVPLIWTPGHDDKHTKPDGAYIELADCVIRVFDTLVAHDMSPSYLLGVKHAYNLTRPYRHGGKRA